MDEHFDLRETLSTWSAGIAGPGLVTGEHTVSSGGGRGCCRFSGGDFPGDGFISRRFRRGFGRVRTHYSRSVVDTVIGGRVKHKRSSAGL